MSPIPYQRSARVTDKPMTILIDLCCRFSVVVNVRNFALIAAIHAYIRGIAVGIVRSIPLQRSARIADIPMTICSDLCRRISVVVNIRNLTLISAAYTIAGIVTPRPMLTFGKHIIAVPATPAMNALRNLPPHPIVFLNFHFTLVTAEYTHTKIQTTGIMDISKLHRSTCVTDFLMIIGCDNRGTITMVVHV